MWWKAAERAGVLQGDDTATCYHISKCIATCYHISICIATCYYVIAATNTTRLPEPLTNVVGIVDQDGSYVGMVGKKSTDKILHNMLTSCDHLLSMFYLLLTILIIFSVFI